MITNFENFKKEVLEAGFLDFAYDRIKCKPGTCGKINCDNCEFQQNNYDCKYESCYESKLNWLDKAYINLTPSEYQLMGMLQDGNLEKYNDNTMHFYNAATDKTFFFPTQKNYPFKGIEVGTVIVILNNEIDDVYRVEGRLK